MAETSLKLDHGVFLTRRKAAKKTKFSIKSPKFWHPRTPKVGKDGQAEDIRELCQALWVVKEIYGICGCSNQAWLC